MIDVEKIRRDEFPITRRGAYFDNATLGPPPVRHVRAVTEFLERMSSQGLEDLFEVSEAGVDAVRARAAALLNADASRVFFVRSTSHGVGVVAEGLQWRDGDEVVLYELDHPAGVFPWLNLADRGVKVRFIKDRGRFGFDAEDVRELVTPRTRAVCVSLVNFAHGTRADVEGIAAICRERGIWFVVDAVQALGALRVDAAGLGADLVVAHGYKFLLSGFGLGIACCSDRALAELKVRQVGWNSVENPFDVDRILAFDMTFPPSARRFEPSFQPLPQVFGLGATLELFHEVGVDVIEKRVLALAGRLAAGLQTKGYEVVGPQATEARSPIVSVAMRSDHERARVQRGLLASTTTCAVRESRVRLSPHFYNTEAEIDRLLSCL
ncbi:MAG TPA: aminotransferase class V-fold PLP-dependent enzyme [Candidatus Dormibacteraeota bacterium]|nr:aminotransferase class V-fold PLP-dependent enzyme [Candidatus Dormibacteraeota bacterium]